MAKIDQKEHSTSKGLYRSETNRIIAGVCGGIGEYLGQDPTIVRIIFIIITIFGGSGILIYAILWLLIPTKSHSPKNNGETISSNIDEMKSTVHSFAHDIRSNNHSGNRPLWAIILIIFGLILLFRSFGFFDIFSNHDFWPILLIVLGLIAIFK